MTAAVASAGISHRASDARGLGRGWWTTVGDLHGSPSIKKSLRPAQARRVRYSSWSSRIVGSTYNTYGQTFPRTPASRVTACPRRRGREIPLHCRAASMSRPLYDLHELLDGGQVDPLEAWHLYLDKAANDLLRSRQRTPPAKWFATFERRMDAYRDRWKARTERLHLGRSSDLR